VKVSLTGDGVESRAQCGTPIVGASAITARGRTIEDDAGMKLRMELAFVLLLHSA